MDMVVVSIFDVKAGVYSRPVFCGSKGLAIRSFQDEVRRVGEPGQLNDLNRHPEDFQLYQVGMFEDNEGVFKPTESGKPVLLFRGIDCA